MSETEPISVWDLHGRARRGAGLGRARQALWFVDIKQQQDPPLRSRRAATSAAGTRREQVGFILPAEDGGFVAGLQSGLYRFDPRRPARFELLAEVEPDLPGNRLNDGVVDPAGRLWFGTMDNGEKAKTGAFYCFAARRGDADRARRHRDHQRPGALARRPHPLFRRHARRARSRPPTSREDGTLGDAAAVRPHRSEGGPSGRPDHRQRRLRLDRPLRRLGGAPLLARRASCWSRVRFPVANITKIAFGGDDLRTVYATTARQLLVADDDRKPAADRRPVRVPRRRARECHVRSASLILARALLASLGARRRRPSIRYSADHGVHPARPADPAEGTAAPGERVSVTFAGPEQAGDRRRGGAWQAAFPARAGGRPLRLSVSAPMAARAERHSWSATSGCARASPTWSSRFAGRSTATARSSSANDPRTAAHQGPRRSSATSAAGTRQGRRPGSR